MSASRSAAVSAVGLVLIAFAIASADESPSPALAAVQYVFLALCGFALLGSLIRMGRGE